MHATMSATERLQAAMSRLHISATVTDGPTVETDADGWNHRAYRFRLEVRGEHLGSYPYRAGMAHEPMPAAVDMLGAILSDCASVEPYANSDAEEERNVWPQTRSAWPDRWDEWAGDLGLLENYQTPGPLGPMTDGIPHERSARASLRRIADDFRQMMTHRALLRDRLGSAYLELLDIAVDL